MILTTATVSSSWGGPARRSAAGDGVLSRRVSPCGAAHLAGRDSLLERGSLPAARRGPAGGAAPARSRPGTAPARRRSPPPRSPRPPARRARSAVAGACACRSWRLTARNLTCSPMAEVAIFDARAVFAAVSPAEAIERTRTAFERHAAGEWVMPAKVYVEARAARRLPGDAGPRRRVRDAQVGDLVPAQPRARPAGGRRGAARLQRRDAASCSRSSTAPRSPRCAPAPPRRSRRRRWRARTPPRSGSSAAASTGPGRPAAWRRRATVPGVCFDPRARGGRGARRRAGLERRRARDEAAAQDVVVTVTPADAPVIGAVEPAPRPAPRRARRRRPRQGRGRARSAGSLPPVLRRVGAGLAGRRALDGGRLRGPSTAGG